jgi:hypothetical protein
MRLSKHCVANVAAPPGLTRTNAPAALCHSVLCLKKHPLAIAQQRTVARGRVNQAATAIQTGAATNVQQARLSTLRWHDVMCAPLAASRLLERQNVRLVPRAATMMTSWQQRPVRFATRENSHYPRTCAMESVLAERTERRGQRTVPHASLAVQAGLTTTL